MTATWTPADKHGFGTATSLASKVWFSLEHGELTDVFYPDLGTPSLRDDHMMDWHFDSAPGGNVVQTGRLKLDGTGQRHATLALGFGGATSSALSAAQASLASGFAAVSSAYAAGWHDYLSSLKPAPPSLTTDQELTTYDVSRMVVAAHEDKTFRGAFVASPTAGAPVERPSVVACRYVKACR